jgi:hypothetical protein
VRVQKILQASTAAVGLAEESGYNLVAPLGYSTGDWYGSPALSRGGVRGQRSTPADFSMNYNWQEILQMWVDTDEGDEAELRARGSSHGPVIQTGLKPPSSFRQVHQEIKGDPDRRQDGTELLP